MLKKAGIIAAAATAGVLAMSSLAFAATAPAASTTTKDNVTNTCTFGNASGNASATATGSESLLGAITDLFTSTVTNGATQANDANCTNVNTTDLFNMDSHNASKSVSVSKIKHSYNGLAD